MVTNRESASELNIYFSIFINQIVSDTASNITVLILLMRVLHAQATGCFFRFAVSPAISFRIFDC